MKAHHPPRLLLETLDRVLAGEHTPEEHRTVLHALSGMGVPSEHPTSVLHRLQTANGRDVPSEEAVLRAASRLRTEMLDEAVTSLDHARMKAGSGDRRGESLSGSRSGIHWPRFQNSPSSARPWRPWSRVILGAMVAGAGLLAVIKIPVLTGRTDASPFVKVDQEYITRRGERAPVDLPDGSRAVLAPGSRLHFSAGENGSRTIKLEGQAYFTVAHDARRSFIVQAGGVETRVLGTSFSVRAYATDRHTQIVVADGKVAIASAASSAVLLPGDVGTIAPDRPATVTRDTKTGDAFGWMHGQVGFNDVPLRDVVIELERLYDIDIHIATPSLASRTVNMAATTQSASAVLETIALVVGATYSQNGRMVVLRGN